MGTALAGLHAVIPTLAIGRLDNVMDMVARLAAEGATATVVANGATIHRALEDRGFPVVSAGRNLGFSAAVNLGASAREDWSWLLILNDDIVLTDVAALVDVVDSPDENRNTIVTFGDEPYLPVPRLMDVFASLSLMSGIRRKLSAGRRRRLDTAATEWPSYFPFSAVAIGRPVWDALGGLDERFPFTYEDADFTRRALAIGSRQRQLTTSGLSHLRSETARANVGRVLPATSWAALLYLRKWWRRGGVLPRLICITALCLRLILIPFSRAAPRDHAIGTLRAIRAILRDREPALPAYEAF